MAKADGNKFQINGRVVEIRSKRGVAGLRVEAWDKDLLFNDLVGSDVTDAEGRFRIEFSGSYFRELFFDRQPDLFFKIFSGRKLIKSTRDSVMWNVRAGSIPVEVAVPWDGGRPGGDGLYVVAGAATSPDRPGVGGLRVEIVDRNVGRDDVALADTTTDARGRYRASFVASSVSALGKERPDLQARVYAGGALLAASEVRYNAAERETLNVALPANSAALASEHETLTGTLSEHYGGRLGDLKETAERQDITYLANKTGWDARAVALAALADKFSRDYDASAGGAGEGAIPPAFFYALFRAGLPADPDTLYQAAPQTAERVWKQAVAQGVIPAALEPEIGRAVEAFRLLAARRLLTGAPPAGASSLREMLAVSNLDEARQQRFAELYTTHRADLSKFWETVAAEFGAEAAARLQLDGKLGFLTLNNAPLLGELRGLPGDRPIADPVELARRGLYRADRWHQLLKDNVPVPAEIPGDTAEAKRRNYADYLAAQVRLSYPTASVAEMVRNRELPVRARAEVSQFLSEHQGKFEIGAQPVQQYIARNRLEVAPEIVAEVKRLQRVYQITPNDRATAALLNHGLDAAALVVRRERGQFIADFAEEMGGAGAAALTYDRSLQTYNTVVHVALSYLTAQNGFGLGAQSEADRLRGDGDGQIVQPHSRGPSAANADSVIAYPTLEALFGSMDFCACDHCRSILSPAAYLVDLLFFIDRPEEGAANPLEVLLARRPDLQHLPLTCENTNTALPYIDVVNEALEHFVVNARRRPPQLSLDGYEGHDTQGAASEDLLASPQFVAEAAYAELRRQRFPAPLPFHQPLENLRRYFDKFEVPLTLAMERLRKGDALERGADAYAWRDILMEELRLSRPEYEILTDSAAVPLRALYGFADDETDAAVFAALSNAKQFARRAGVTYEEIVALLKTRFVNPNSDLIPRLERLGVFQRPGLSFAAIKAFKAGNLSAAQFDALLPQGALAPDPDNYGGDIKAWVRAPENYDRVMRIITLVDTTAGDDPCDFGALEFRRSEPTADIDDTSTRLNAAEFVRLMRFIRLWKKLGWTIEQTDAALCALFPGPPAPPDAAALDTVAKLDAGFRRLLPRLGVVLRVMRALDLTPKRDLLPLLACWSPLGTHGEASLYRQLFLSRALPAHEAAFGDRGSGAFLQDDTQKLLDHAETLRAAFGLTGEEFSQIAAALGFDADFAEVAYAHPRPALEQPILDAAPGIAYDHNAKRLSHAGALDAATRDALKALPGVSPQFQAAVDHLFAANQLTLEHVSAIYRRGWLARKLKLSVRELLLLMRLTGLDPFAAPEPPGPDIMRLIDLVRAMRDRSLKSAAALYLIWNQDLSGKSAPDPAQVAELARVLRNDFAAIEDELAAAGDGGEIARARMAQVYGSEAADAFFALIDETLALDVAYAQAQPALDNAFTAIDPRLAYDHFRHRLSRTGLLGAATRDALKAAAAPADAPFSAAVDALFARGEDARGSFFARHPELKPLYDAVRDLDQTLVRATDYAHTAANLDAAIAAADARLAYDDPTRKLSYSGLLTPARRDALKAAPGVSPALAAALDALFALSQEEKGKVLAALRPELSRRRKRQQALQRLSAAAAVDPDFARALLDPPAAPYPLHADGEAARPALDDVLALDTRGLAARFFFRDTATGAVDESVAAATLDYAAGGDNPLPVNNRARGARVSGIWSGRIEAPEAGYYNFVVEADAGAHVRLSLGGQERPLERNGNAWRNRDAIELAGGTLYEFTLTVERVRNTLAVKWETPKRARTVIGGRYLYPQSIFPPFDAAYPRFLKAASLAQALRLTAGELSRFATDPDYLVDGDDWLNALPVVGDPAPPVAAALAKPLRALLDFARIKAEVSPDDESLLAVLRDPAAAAAAPDGPLFAVTRWDGASLADLLSRFGGDVAGLARFDQFRRVYDAFALLRKMGVRGGALIAATTNDPGGDTVRALQAALRARYEAADWRSLVQPINDGLRALQRDALVAHVLHLMRSDPAGAHIDTADKLFEYFLMDVQMEPCMQTSRVRHALSSVQLFIERCLMNLESPRVAPSSVSAKRWEWMKRYRVWEANRKVFLFPENWLEPELRDNKSPFFKEIESQLLQSDITEETATVALLNYLAKLEEVAKLEPCGIYHVEGTAQAGEVDHVVARTAGANRKYYYRRRDGGTWTPWEEIKLDIEDDPVAPVVWNNRLLLFWLRLIKQGPETGQRPTPAGEGAGESPITELKLGDLPGDPRVTVKAVLCWSEYYNGKWQATKTSDVNRPTELGSFPLDVVAGLDRAEFSLTTTVVGDADGPGGDALLITINGAGSSSFLLHNTHSLPVREEDWPSPPSEVPTEPPLRYLTNFWADESLRGQFWGYYYKAGTTSDNPPTHRHRILRNQMQSRVRTPRHELPNPWEAPFFYEDKRHVFFVRAEHVSRPSLKHQDYGTYVVDAGKGGALAFPTIVFEEETVMKPPRTWDVFVGPDPGPLVNPGPMKRFVTEDAYIRRGIAAGGSVTYNGSRVGPQGMIPDAAVRRRGGSDGETDQ